MEADRNNHDLNDDESSPFLENQEPINGEFKSSDLQLCEKKDPSPPLSLPSPPPPPPPPCKPSVPLQPETYGWTADGVPLSMVGRTPWDTGLAHCLGRQDEFCSSDLEVCLLGCVAPCVLYGSNVERLGSAPRAFTSHCMAYTALCLIGNSFFGWNCLAPWLSYNSRTNLRRRFNLEGTFESLARSHGCCESLVEDEVQREQCEIACDFATHGLCHPCALCQEGREIRRRLLTQPSIIRQLLSCIHPESRSWYATGHESFPLNPDPNMMDCTLTISSRSTLSSCEVITVASILDRTCFLTRLLFLQITKGYPSL